MLEPIRRDNNRFFISPNLGLNTKNNHVLKYLNVVMVYSFYNYFQTHSFLFENSQNDFKISLTIACMYAYKPFYIMIIIIFGNTLCNQIMMPCLFLYKLCYQCTKYYWLYGKVKFPLNTCSFALKLQEIDIRLHIDIHVNINDSIPYIVTLWASLNSFNTVIYDLTIIVQAK